MQRSIDVLETVLTTFRALLARLGQGTLLRRVVGNVLWQMSDKIARMAVGLIVGIWIARYLGPEDFGLLNFAIAFVALFTPFADLGLQAVVVRDLNKRPDDRLQIVASALALRLIGACVAFTLSMAAILWFRPDSGARLAVLAVVLSLLPQAWDVIDYDYQARMHARPVVVIRTVSLMTFAAIKIGMIAAGANVAAFALAITGEAALSALSMRVLFKAELPRFGVSRASAHEMRRLLESCWPLAVAAMSVVLYMRMDQVMLSKLVNDHAVGIFSAAVRVSESWYFVPMAITAAIAPALTAAHAQSGESYRRKMMLSMSAMFYLSICAAVLFTIWADEIIVLLFGANYAEASDVLVIHAWTGVFVCFGLGAGPWFVNGGMLK
jgi:PST family polysaccharide transporter